MAYQEFFLLLAIILIGIITSRRGRNLLLRLLFPSYYNGKAAERRIARILKRAFGDTTYSIFNDVLFEYGELITQVDHVVISTRGVFVVETKDLKGWIFGNPENRMWTQTIYGDKYRFLNPLRQNYKHQKVIEKTLDLNSRFIQSMVVFTEKCEIRTPMPENVLYDSEIITYVKDYQRISIDETEVISLTEKLQEVKLPKTRKNLKRHRKHIRDIKQLNW